MAISELDLSNIVTSTRQMDLTALGQIFDTYAPKIYKYILFRLGDAPQSQEIVQEVFDGLLETLDQHPKSIGDLQTWLFEVTRNIVEQKLDRSNKSMPANPPNSGDGTISVTRTAQDETTWLGFLVRKAMQKLLPEQQHLLTLRFGGRYAPDEIARIMDRSISDIKVLQMDALVSLRKQLEREA